MTTPKKNGFEVPRVMPEGTVRDFLLPIVEFLGILVPGLLFLLLAIPAIGLPIINGLEFLQGAQTGPEDSFEYVLELVKSSSLGLAGIVLVSSYVAGHVFFRQNPKIPDECSFKRVFVTQKEYGPVRLCEAEIKDNEENNLPSRQYNLEFPYRYLHEYLSDRGMEHLAALIPWRGTDPKTYRHRTKHFINALKIRLEFVFPYQYTRIQRNEAHVRLMSSLWYATNALLIISITGAVIGLVLFVSVQIVNGSWWPLTQIYSVASPLLVLILVLVVKSQIERFLHYQRIREIVFILEATYFAGKLYPGMFHPITGKKGMRDPLLDPSTESDGMQSLKLDSVHDSVFSCRPASN